MFLFQSNVLLYSGSLDHTPVFFIGQLPIPVLVSFLKTDLVKTQQGPHIHCHLEGVPQRLLLSLVGRFLQKKDGGRGLAHVDH